MLPAVVVVHAPVASESKHPDVNPLGSVTVAMAVVPEIITMGLVGAIVVLEATVETALFCINVFEREVNAAVPGVVAPMLAGLIAAPVANTAAPDPVSSLRTPASCADVVAANCDRGLPVTPQVGQESAVVPDNGEDVVTPTVGVGTFRTVPIKVAAPVPVVVRVIDDPDPPMIVVHIDAVPAGSNSTLLLAKDW